MMLTWTRSHMEDSYGECGKLCDIFGKRSYNGMFVTSNASKLKPKTKSKHSLGNIICSMDIGNGFRWDDESATSVRSSCQISVKNAIKNAGM